MGWYWVILVVLAIVCAVLLYIEDNDALSKRKKANLPLYPLVSTAPQDLKPTAKKLQSLE